MGARGSNIKLHFTREARTRTPLRFVCFIVSMFYSFCYLADFSHIFHIFNFVYILPWTQNRRERFPVGCCRSRDAPREKIITAGDCTRNTRPSSIRCVLFDLLKKLLRVPARDFEPCEIDREFLALRCVAVECLCPPTDKTAEPRMTHRRQLGISALLCASWIHLIAGNMSSRPLRFLNLTTLSS